MIVNMHEAKTQLSKLIRRVEAGEEIIIGRNDRPVARLVPYQDRPTTRAPGRLRGRIRIAEDFDATSEEVLRDFEASST